MNPSGKSKEQKILMTIFKCVKLENLQSLSNSNSMSSAGKASYTVPNHISGEETTQNISWGP